MFIFILGNFLGQNVFFAGAKNAILIYLEI